MSKAAQKTAEQPNTEQPTTEQPTTEQQKPALKLTVLNGFSACEDGCVVNTYEPGEYESLPAVALEHGLAIGAFSDETVQLAQDALDQAKQTSEA